MRSLLIFLGSVIAVLAVGWAIRPLEDGDLFTHIVVGRHLFAQPTLTIAEGSRHVWVSWLAYLAFATVDGAFGLPGVKGLNILLLSSAFILVGGWSALVRREPKDVGEVAALPLVLALASAWAVSLTNAAARPQSFAYLAFALVLVLLELCSRRALRVGPAACAVVVVSILWQNLHPSLVLSGPLILVYIVTRGVPPWFLAIPLACSLCTPDGWRLFSISAYNMEISRDVLGVSEWLPPWHPVVRDVMLYFWIVLLGTTLLCMTILCRTVSVSAKVLLLSGGFLILTLSSSRFGVFWAMLNVPLVAATVEQVWRGSFGRVRVGALRRAPLVVLFVSAALVILTLLPRALPNNHAITMVRELKVAYPTARIFNYREIGGLLEYVGYPGWRTYIDGRLYLFGRDVWESYHTMALASDPRLIDRAKREFDLLVLHEGYHAALIRYLEITNEWKIVRHDAGLVVFAPAVAVREGAA